MELVNKGNYYLINSPSAFILISSPISVVGNNSSMLKSERFEVPDN
jgi:hypothetical protein